MKKFKVKDLIEYLNNFDKEDVVAFDSEIGPFFVTDENVDEIIFKTEIDFVDEQNLNDPIDVVLIGISS